MRASTKEGNRISMGEDFGDTFITIEDEEGNQFELEHLDTLEFEGEEYMVFLPADMSEDDPDYGFVILRVEEVDGEDELASVEDETLLQRVYDYYIEQLYAEDEEEPPEG